jgi:hypothetical protein
MFSNFVELTRFGGELSFCAPSDYIKITDDKYIYSRVEAEFSGTIRNCAGVAKAETARGARNATSRGNRRPASSCSGTF